MNQEQSIYEYLEYSDLNEGMKLIADSLGMGAVRQLLESYPNETVYIPQTLSLMRNAIKKHMQDRLANGKRVDLSYYKKTLGCSYRYLQYIINEIYEEKRTTHNDRI